MQNGYEDSQVACQRLLGGYEVEALLFEFETLPVNGVVLSDDFLGQRHVAILERVEGFDDGFFHHSAKLEEVGLELPEVSIEIYTRHLDPPFTHTPALSLEERGGLIISS